MRKRLISFALTLALLLVSVGIKAQTSTVYLDIDFEDCATGTGSVPAGWNNQDFTQGTSTSTSMNTYLWYVSTSTTAGYSHSGNKYAYLYAYSTYTSASRLKTPAMSLSSTKAAKVSFWLRNYKSTSASYQFGDFSLYVSTDGGTTYTQNPVVEHVYTGQDWTYYEYSLDAFKGQTITLVFQGASSGSTSTYAYYYLDDIKVEEAPTCQAPKDPYINGLSGTTATFNWSLDTRFGIAPASYSVTLKDEAGSVIYHNGAELQSGVNFSNLQPNTTYIASVMSDCSAAYQGKSDSVSISFTTLPPAINPPLVENFDSMADFADGYYVKNATINTTASYSYGTAGNSVKLTTTATDDAYIIFPLMNIAANNIEMDFMMRRLSAATTTIGAIPYAVGYLTDPSDVTGFVPAMQESLEGDASWRNIRFNTSSIQDVTTPVMLCIQIGEAYATSVYIDEVDIHVIPSCTRPEHLTVSDVHDTYATLSWDMANATSFLVKAMNMTDSTVTTYTANQNPYQVTGLTQNTEYEITVQGACSATDSSEVSRPVTAKTECSVAESAIFLENFDNLGTQPIPDCWKMDWIVKPSNNTKTAPFATGTTKHSGTKGMSLVDQQAGSISYLSTGALPFDVAGKYNFSIWVNRATYSTMKNNEGIQIWITNAPGDTVGGTMLAYIHREPSLTPVDNAGWHQYEYNIPVQGNKYVTIVGISEYGAATWFDDVEVMLAPSCPKVTGISLADVAATSADVAWTAGKDETQWVVNYTLKQGTANVLDTTFVANTASFSVEGLTPATNYTVMGSVRALCGVGDTAEAVSFSFPVKTQCLPMALLPYTIDFENETTGTSTATSVPECWSQFNDASGTYNGYPYVSSTTYYHSGSKGLYFYTTTTTTYAEHQMAILPAIDVTAHPINTLRIKFWAKRSTTTSYADAPMIIGVMSNPTDLNSFVAVDTVVVSNTSDPQEYIVLLDQYVGNGANIAIRLDRQSTTCYCYMDDITVEPIPNCQDLEGSATVTDNTESSVKITLDDQTATSAWSFAYGPAGTHVTQMTAVDTTGAVIVLNNLASATAYDLYVRRNCGNGDYSPWSSVVKFSTTAVPATIPYICGFEDSAEASQWQYSQGNNANNFVVGTVSTAVHAGTQSMYVSADNGETNAYTGTSSRNYAYRTIHFDAKGYQIEYYWRCAGGEGTTIIYDYGRVMLLPVSESIVGGAGTNITSSNPQAGFPTNAIMLNPEEKGYMSLDGSDWHFESFFVNMTAAPGNYNLVLAWNNDGSGGTTNDPLAIDDITITELTCIPPVTIVPSAITANSAALSVSQAGATQWEFVVDTIAFTKDAVPAAPFQRINSTDGNAAITGLTPNTEYFYSVRTICGEGDTSAWLAPASLRTYCTAYDVPYTEGFENVGATNCWSMMADESGEASVERATTYHKSGTASLKGVKASIVSPEFNVDSLTHYMINGWAYSTTDNAQFAIGVIVDPNDVITYQGFSNVVIPVKNTWTEFTAYFTDLADPDYEDYKYAKNIVLACGGENTLYFDDIMVALTPECPKPTEVAITNITAHSFDISFTDNASASQWVVYTNGTPNVIATNPATISNLTASMNYAVSIAAVCSATDTSDVTDCGTIRTLCDKTSTPWVCGFESTEGYVGATSYNAETTAANFENNCWTVFNQKPGGATYPYAYVSTSSTYVHSGAQGVYTYTSSAATKNLYMMLPDLSDPSNMLRINVWYKNAGGTTASYADLEFGYWTDPTADTSFVTVYTFPKSSTTTTWTEGEIMTNNASYNIPANARIGFMIDRNSTGYGLYLDDISVNLIRNCSDPATPTVSDITAASAKVTFADTCRTHAAWEYVYGPVGFDPNTATPVSIDTTAFTLTGLTDDSNYDVYVRAVCGVGDVSNYVPASFRTKCLPFHVTATTPFFEDFNNYNYGAYLNNGTCYTILGEDLSASNSYWAKAYPASEPSATATTFYFYGHSADRYDRSLYWSLYKTYISNGTFLRQFHLDAGTTYEMSAWARNSTTTSYSTLLSAMMGTTANDLDTLASLVLDGVSMPSRSIDGHTTYPYNEYYQEIKAFITPDSTGDYYIGFNAAINNTQSYSYLYFDDWSIKAFTGVAPKVPNIDSVTTNAAYISVNDSDYYQFEYVLNDTTLATTVVDANVFVINGLSPSTTYTLYMRKYGDATTYSEWISVTFATECGAVTEFPYTQDFEGDFPPACWGQFTYGTPDHVWASTTSSTYVHSGSKAASIADKTAGAKTVLTSGEFNLTSPDGYYVRFWIYRAASSSYVDKVDEALHVGYYNAPITANNINSVNEIGVINRNVANAPAESSTAAGYYMYEFEVPAGVLGSVWFSFDYHNQYGGGIYLDDITIEPIPSCVTPKDAPVVASTTMTTATVTVNMKNKNLAEVAWVLPTNTDSIIGTATTTTGTAIATGLSGSTTYRFMYRFICAEGDTSAWSPMGNGTTTASDCFAPQNVRTVGMLNDHHAEITWGKAPDAVAYQYILKQGNNVIDSAVNMNDTIVYDSLAANTIYVFKVRTLCAYDTSAWITLNIQTTYPIFTLPFICGFENPTQNNGWQMHRLSTSGDNQYVIGNSTSYSGQNALYVSDDNSTYNYASGATVSDAEVLLEIPAGNYYVSYDWNCNGEGTTTIWDYGRVFLAPSNTTISGTSYTAFNTSLPAGSISLDGGHPLNKSEGWTNYTEIVNIPNDGVYKLVVIWANDATAYQPPFAIDNIRIEEVSCMPVASVNINAVYPTSAEAVITPYADSVTVEYALSIYDTEDSVSTWTVATGDTILFDHLATGTAYTLFARHACSATDKSPVKMVSFLTPNNSVQLPFVATFEANDTLNQHWTMTSGQALNWFTIGNATSAAGSKSMYVTDDGSSHHYSCQSGNLVNSYAYIPIQFPAGSFDVTYQWYCHGESSFDYGHLFLVPSSVIPEDNILMTGMSGSAVPTGAISLDGTLTKLNSADTLNHVWFDVATELVLENAGTYNLVVAWHNDGSVTHQPPLAVDNIKIKQLTCPKPVIEDMSIDSSSTDMIRLKISGMTPGKGISYHVASDNTYSDTIATGVVYDSLVTLTGLSASTRYYARISYVCSVGDTSSVLSIYFRTNCGIVNQFPYVEDFEMYTASSTEKTQLDDNCWLTSSTSTSAYYYMTTTASYVHSGSKALDIYNSSTSGTSQTFGMPKVDTLAGKRLSMWYKSYGTTATYAKLEVGYLTNPDNTNSFVLLSTAPLTSAYTEYVVNYPANVPVGARPAFRANGTYYMYVDDIRLNKLIQGPAYEETLCFGQGYNGHGFTCMPGSLAPGDTTMTTIAPALVAGAPDTTVTLTLHVLSEIVTEYYDTICAGQSYNEGLFNIPANMTHLGYFFQTFPGASSAGCDSTVSLHLYVFPSRETINDTICQGDVYPFDGQNLTQSGTYTAYTVNSHSCNDTITLNLFVVDSVAVTNATICNGETYSFEGRNYTTAGTYRVPGTGIHGCPFAKILNLTVVQNDTTVNVSFCQGGYAMVDGIMINTFGQIDTSRWDATINCTRRYHITATEKTIPDGNVSDVVCEGYPYVGNGLNGVIITNDTTYDNVVKTAEMCDSTVHVTVHVIRTVYSSFDIDIKEGESYEFNETNYSTSGEYTATFQTTNGCDSVVTLRLHVSPVGVENVTSVKIDVVPNPVTAGMTAYVYGDFGEVENVEILNNFGQVVDRFVPSTYPIEVQGIETSGLYYVRVNTTDGKVYTEKLIVK